MKQIMSRMIDLVRTSAAPANLMQAAARGALSVPSDEMVEILVYLATHNKVFGQLARMTLAGWDEKSCMQIAASPQTPQEVLDYWISNENIRPNLLPALIENPAISDAKLLVMASDGSREVVSAMGQSGRIQKLSAVMQALAANPNSTNAEAVALSAQAEVATNNGTATASDDAASGSAAEDPTNDQELSAFLAEHAKELAFEGEKPFQAIGGIYEFEHSASDVNEADGNPPPAEPATAPETVASGEGANTATKPATKPTPPKKAHLSAEAERGSSLQKISKLDVKGRIQLAMKGNKEERSILIRDSTKLVALAVLESGKITDGEVEKFASQKNVLEAVLRQIPMKRRFAKNYNVVRNLVANPRTPLDISLGLMKNILTADLRNLASNKEVSDTIRKLALKMFKQKTDTKKGSG
jgi:hypothetical protein